MIYSQQQPKNGRVRYLVKPGDCLSVIAEKVYGKASLWPDLAAANRIQTPHYIQVGQIIRTPVLNIRDQNSKPVFSVVRTASEPRPSTTASRAHTMLPAPPKSLNRCKPEITFGPEVLKAYFPDFEPAAFEFAGMCLKATLTILEPSLKVTGKGVDQCTNAFGVSEFGAELSADRKLNEFLKIATNLSFKFNPKTQKLTLEASSGLTISNLFGNDWKFDFGAKFVQESNGKLKESIFISASSTQKFIIQDLECALTAKFELELEASHDECPRGEAPVSFRPKSGPKNRSFTQFQSQPVPVVIAIGGPGLAVGGRLISTTITRMLSVPAAMMLLLYGIYTDELDRSNRYSTDPGIL